MSDNDYIDLIIKGNNECYKHLVNRYAKMSFAVAYRIVKDSDDSQDIVQEAFIAAYENLKEFKGESKFSTWLYRIVTNKALAFKNKQKFFDEIEDHGHLDVEYDKDVDTKNELQVKKALLVLNDKERFIIELFYYQEQSIKEIALIVVATEANVKVLLHRARKKMNDYIQSSFKFAPNE